MPDGTIASEISTAARASPISESARKRLRAVTEEIQTAISKYSTPGFDKEQQMILVSEKLAANPAIVSRLIEAELTADDFVQGVTSRESGSYPQTVCIVQSSIPPTVTAPQHAAHEVESCQSSLMTSTSQPIVSPKDLPK